MPKDPNSDPVVRRLDVLIRLVLEYQKEKKKETIGEQIVFLENTGLLAPTEVARIMGLELKQLSSYRRTVAAKTGRKKNNR